MNDMPLKAVCSSDLMRKGRANPGAPASSTRAAGAGCSTIAADALRVALAPCGGVWALLRPAEIVDS